RRAAPRTATRPLIGHVRLPWRADPAGCPPAASTAPSAPHALNRCDCLTSHTHARCCISRAWVILGLHSPGTFNVALYVYYQHSLALITPRQLRTIPPPTLAV